MATFEKSTGEEDLVLNMPRPISITEKTILPKPTLQHSESTYPVLSEKTFKNPSIGDLTSKNSKKPTRLTFFLKPEEIMLSSFQNLPKMNYFAEIKNRNYIQFGDIMECDFGFSFRKFFLFAFYHFLYYFILGPLIYPILYFWKGKPILANLSFWSWNYFCLTQTVEYLMIILSLILYCVYIPKEFLYGCELYTIYISVVFWIGTLSIKYATMNDEKTRFLHEKYVSMDDMLSESIIFYKTKKPELEKHIMKELLAVISRNDIDISLFQVKFIRDLESFIQNQLLENEKELNNGKVLYSEQDKKYSGISLVKKIITLGFEDNFNLRDFEIISVVLAFVISSIPFFYKFYDGRIYSMNAGYVFVSLFFLLSNARFYYKNMVYGLNILYEYKKLVVFLSQLSHLLSPKMVLSYHDLKIFPTLDIFNPTILESWDIMHRICRNFDKKLRLRIDCFISLAIILNLAGAILIIIILTGHEEYFSGFYVFSIFLNICFASIIGCALIRYGVIINYHYEAHKRIIRNNVKVYSDFSNHYQLYFDQEEGKFENELYQEGTLRIKNYSYDYCVKNSVKKSITEEQFLKNLKKTRLNLINCLRKVSKMMIGNLEFQSKDEPFKIIGIPATSPILTSILGIVVSFAIAVLQLQIKKYLIVGDN